MNSPPKGLKNSHLSLRVLEDHVIEAFNDTLCQPGGLEVDEVMPWMARILCWYFFLWVLAEDAAEFPEDDGVLVLTECFGMHNFGTYKG